MMKINLIFIVIIVCMILLISLPLSTSALTTFGKTSPQNLNPPPPPTPVGKARECKAETDCNAIQNTTCMADPRDGKTRCLCGDYSAPINGLCTNKYKAVRAPCNDHDECGEGAHCIENNNTMTGKKCQCMEGYYEENYKCNGGISLLTNPIVVVLSLVLMILKTITLS